MNISKLICQAIRHYGASIELINNQTLRLNQADHLPQQCTDLIRKYKPQLIRHLQLQKCYELLEYLQQEGVELELIDRQTIRLHHAECIADKEMGQVRKFKPDIIEILDNALKNVSEKMDNAIQQEIIQTYFDRLERHRRNLRKINNPVENALVKPEHVRQDLIQKFALSQEQAQQFINALIEQCIFKYDSNFKYYLFPNFDHSAMTAFHHHNDFAQVD